MTTLESAPAGAEPPKKFNFQNIERKFIYNGTELPDPGPSIQPEQCRGIFAQTHPEIANAALDGPEVSGNVHTYTFVRSVGTKG